MVRFQLVKRSSIQRSKIPKWLILFCVPFMVPIQPLLLVGFVLLREFYSKGPSLPAMAAKPEGKSPRVQELKGSSSRVQGYKKSKAGRGARLQGSKGSSVSGVQGFKGFKGPRAQGSKGARVQGSKGSRVQRGSIGGLCQCIFFLGGWGSNLNTSHFQQDIAKNNIYLIFILRFHFGTTARFHFESATVCASILVPLCASILGSLCVGWVSIKFEVP